MILPCGSVSSVLEGIFFYFLFLFIYFCSVFVYLHSHFSLFLGEWEAFLPYQQSFSLNASGQVYIGWKGVGMGVLT